MKKIIDFLSDLLSFRGDTFHHYAQGPEETRWFAWAGDQGGIITQSLQVRSGKYLWFLEKSPLAVEIQKNCCILEVVNKGHEPVGTFLTSRQKAWASLVQPIHPRS